jgi:hypothetical protein
MAALGLVADEDTDGNTPAGPAKPIGRPVATDEQINLAIARLGRIVPEVDAVKFMVDLAKHFDGVPVACTQMISALYDRVTDARQSEPPDPADVYPEREPDRPGYRNTGD